MTQIEDFPEDPFTAVCLALRMIGVDFDEATQDLALPEDREGFRMAVTLSPGMTLEADHDPSEDTLSLSVLVAGAADRSPVLHHALAVNDLLPLGRGISLRPSGALAIRGLLSTKAAPRLQPEEIAAEAADLVLIAELLETTADAGPLTEAGTGFEEIIRG